MGFAKASAEPEEFRRYEVGRLLKTPDLSAGYGRI
jgi:hypothetical protein